MGSGARARAGTTLSLLICKMGMVVPLKGLSDKCTAECPMSIVAPTITVQGQREEGQELFEGGGEVCLEIGGVPGAPEPQKGPECRGGRMSKGSYLCPHTPVFLRDN